MKTMFLSTPTNTSNITNPNESSSNADSDVVTAATAVASSSTSSYSVLSEKVNRAISVRTDTPAMKAALDALSQLETASSLPEFGISGGASGNDSGGVVNVLDARNVRVAIEYDALQQALHLQAALQSIVRTVHELRIGISAVTGIAQNVRRAAHQQVDVSVGIGQRGSSMYPTISSGAYSNNMLLGMLGESKDDDGGSYNDINNSESLVPGTTDIGTNSNDSTSNEEAFGEQKLASMLMDAFVQRDNARKRLQAITEFMEKFDLSERDSYLLENYNFEDRTSSNLLGLGGSSTRHSSRRFGHSNSANATDDAHEDDNDDDDGIAFLKALDRVRSIRFALQKQTLFGNLDADHATTTGFFLRNNSNSSTTSADDDLRGGASSSSSSAAIRMMENLADKQERAYERLYHWLQKYLHLFPKSVTSGNKSKEDEYNNNDDNDDGMSSSPMFLLDEILTDYFVKLALSKLRHVPAFYCHTIELIATSRRSEVTRRFLVALTAGYDHLPPIEMKSHDTVAYVGDMLAFSFRAFSVEADVAKGLLEFNVQNPTTISDNSATAIGEAEGKTENPDGSGTNDKKNNNDDDDDEDLHATDEDYATTVDRALGPREMLSISMSGLARPLKSRILQVISTLSRRPAGDDPSNKDSKLIDADNDDDDYEYGIGDDEFGEECSRFRSKIANLYDVCGLLLFYVSAMDKTIEKLQKQQQSSLFTGVSRGVGADIINPLVASLAECFKESTVSYEATVRVYCAMLDQWSVMTGESESALAQSLLLRIADVRMNSPGFSTDIIDEGLPMIGGSSSDTSYRTVLSMEWVTQTLIETCLNKCNALDDILYLKEALKGSVKAGVDAVVSEQLKESINSKEQILIDELVTTEASHVLDSCGLGLIASAYRAWQAEHEKRLTGTTTTIMLMSSYPGLSQSIIETAMNEFYTSLYSPPIPTLEGLIKDPIVRRITRSKISDYVSQLYTDLYNSIVSTATGGYKNIRFLEHSPEQVKTLFAA